MKTISVQLKLASVLIIISFVRSCVQETVNTKRNDDGDQLKMAHIICRHGDRNIYKIYPNDPWKDESYWPEGFAQLTELGRQEHYILGAYLRQRYSEIVGDFESATRKIYIQSTQKRRVIESAEANIAGFFSSDSSFNWSTVPIHVTPIHEDYVLAAEKQCDHFDYLMIQYEQTPAYTGLFEENKSLIKYLEENSGLKLETLTDIDDIYDTLMVERMKHFELPAWAEKVMTSNDDFLNLVLQWYKLVTPTIGTKKLKSGFLLREILGNFSNYNQSTSHTLSMYFAHDITISSMLNSLGLFELHMPPYASCIFFELHEINAQPFVQVFYKNDTRTNISPLEIPNCGKKCPLNEFYRLYDEIIPKNSFEEECALRQGEALPPGGNPEKVLVPELTFVSNT